MAKTLHRAEYALLRAQLRELRLQAGMRQVDLSRALGRSQSFVSDIERGSRRLDLVEMRDLCHVLGGDLVDFVRAFERELAAAQTQHPRRPRKRVK